MKNRIILPRKLVLFKPKLNSTREHILYKKLPVSFSGTQKGKLYATLHTRVRVEHNSFINIFIYGKKKSLISLKDNTFHVGEIVILESYVNKIPHYDSIHFFVDVVSSFEGKLPILKVLAEEFIVPSKDKFLQIVPPQGGNILLERIKKAV